MTYNAKILERICTGRACHAKGQPQPRAEFELSQSRYLATRCRRCREIVAEARRLGREARAKQPPGPRFAGAWDEANHRRWLAGLAAAVREVSCGR